MDISHISESSDVGAIYEDCPGDSDNDDNDDVDNGDADTDDKDDKDDGDILNNTSIFCLSHYFEVTNCLTCGTIPHQQCIEARVRAITAVHTGQVGGHQAHTGPRAHSLIHHQKHGAGSIAGEIGSPKADFKPAGLGRFEYKFLVIQLFIHGGDLTIRVVPDVWLSGVQQWADIPTWVMINPFHWNTIENIVQKATVSAVFVKEHSSFVLLIVNHGQ